MKTTKTILTTAIITAIDAALSAGAKLTELIRSLGEVKALEVRQALRAAFTTARGERKESESRDLIEYRRYATVKAIVARVWKKEAAPTAVKVTAKGKAKYLESIIAIAKEAGLTMADIVKALESAKVK